MDAAKKHESLSNDQAAETMSHILWTIPVLYHRLSAVGEIVYRTQGLTSGKRSLLNDLARKGPHSIIDMVRARPPVSRQYIQRLVAELRNAGLVELTDNPSDLRTKTVSLSEEGRRVISALEPSEQRLASRLADGHSQKVLQGALQVLATMAERLRGGSIVEGIDAQ